MGSSPFEQTAVAIWQPRHDNRLQRLCTGRHRRQAVVSVVAKGKACVIANGAPRMASLTPSNDNSTGEAPAASRGPVRVFVGLKITPDIARRLAEVAMGLDKFAVRRVATDDIHLTLVPPWDEASTSDAADKLQHVADRFGVFTLTIEHVGYGPEPRWPRMLWADCVPTDELLALQAALAEAFGQTNTRPFRPHVTLARIRGNGRIIARKCPIDVNLSLTQQVESVELFQSPPRGEVGYRVLASVPLRKSVLPELNPQ
jgi:2'-5' RNA ligase